MLPHLLLNVLQNLKMLGFFSGKLEDLKDTSRSSIEKRALN